MKNHNKQDKLFVNVITPPDNVKAVSEKSSGNASKEPSVFMTTRDMPSVP
ncbi:MAG TPA: hypothetical protein PK033_08260 [Acetivibrio sp.]|nr:hypothetical protein [Acetivibrio sp.]